MDFDVNELLISDVLYSDGHQHHKEIVECENMVDGDQVLEPSKNMSSIRSSVVDHPVSGHVEAKLEDSMDVVVAAGNWRESTDSHPVQPNADSLDLTTLAAFLNLEDDQWIN